MPRASTNSMEDTDEAMHLVGFEWVGQQHLAQALMEQALNAAGARRAKFAPAVPAPEALVSKRKKDSVSKEPANEKKTLRCVSVNRCAVKCIAKACKNHINTCQDPVEKVTPDPKRDKSCAVATGASPKNLMAELDAAGKLLDQQNTSCMCLPHAGVEDVPTVASSSASAEDPTRLSTMSLSPGTLDTICVGTSLHFYKSLL